MTNNDPGKPFAAAPQLSVEPIIQQIHLPAGIAGADELDFDVRSFLVGDASGVVLIDAGLEGSAPAIEQALGRLGAEWKDITDLVLTHSHPDHVGGLAEVALKAPEAAIWAGASDIPQIASDAPIRPLSDGDHVHGMRILQTPGHTAGHISLLHDDAGILFVGDTVGTMKGAMTRGPSQFTADAAEAELSLLKLSQLQPTRMLFSHGPEIPDPVAQLRRLVDLSEQG
ncbi:MBL fold metallo-hydrolase [Paenarthrobacter sp. A20]|uniref:MBL fold metallo-hydrolase n=1 Tax=Paenarthrobacter sp. A20 TaxID=2817891 RepID=UPI00209F2FE8|nr:MBL fold metallo-hydrolase [Paenarthrobacter sp. A20]MCP1413851.1 glyoxylase-like metal-dependent hydrolase (beta-lactamase superfamily II) [Paenarthrobacter sp. A20]